MRRCAVVESSWADESQDRLPGQGRPCSYLAAVLHKMALQGLFERCG
jgi:hypothetical protein